MEVQCSLSPAKTTTMTIFRSWSIDMCMHSRVSKRNAYQLLITQNSLSSMARVGTCGNQKSGHDGLANHDDSLLRGIPCNEEKRQKSDGMPFLPEFKS